MDENKTPSEIEDLTTQIRKLIRSQNVHNSFIRGISWGLGNLVGTTIVVGIVFWFLSQLPLIPIIGSWMAEIISSAEQNLFAR